MPLSCLILDHHMEDTSVHLSFVLMKHHKTYRHATVHNTSTAMSS